MKLFILLFLFLVSCENKSKKKYKEECDQAIYFEGTIDSKKVFKGEEKGVNYPQFPGGKAKLFDYLKNKTKYPQLAKENNITGKCYYFFIINQYGEVCCLRNQEGDGYLGFGCEEEGLRVLKNMPKWVPAELNGQKVNFRFSIPVNFGIDY